jgi:IS30 family transposase
MVRTRRATSFAEKADLWKRWKDGESCSDIARALGRGTGTVHWMLREGGGIAPPERHRNARVLTLGEREEISRGLSGGESIREIAGRLSRAPSTVSRELRRNGGSEGYRAAGADGRAWNCARRPKQCKLAIHPRLRRLVAAKLSLKWSPEQISGWLSQQHPGEDAMNVSHETIYRSLFVQTRGVLKKELQEHLRSGRVIRQSKKATRTGQNRGKIVDAVSIRERPASAEDRAVPGHWEGDLLTGTNNSHIATLVERRSRFTMLVKVRGKDTASVVRALSRQVQKLPAELRRTLTWDRGMELSTHKAFSIATDMKVYFCDPQSPWQRGTNENTNGLLRQYFPVGPRFSDFSQSDLNRVARRLNERPRKTLAFTSPADMFHRTLQ